MSPAAFRMHLAIVSELGPRPGAKGFARPMREEPRGSLDTGLSTQKI